MKRSFPFIIFISLSLLVISCKSKDEKTGKTGKTEKVDDSDGIGAGYCNCLKNIEEQLSDDTKEIVIRAANADDPVRSLQADVIEMGEKKGKKIGEEMERVQDMEDENSETGRCIKKLEKKYKDVYAASDEKAILKVINDLDGNDDCEFTVALLKLGLKMKNNPEEMEDD